MLYKNENLRNRLYCHWASNYEIKSLKDKFKKKINKIKFLKN